MGCPWPRAPNHDDHKTGQRPTDDGWPVRSWEPSGLSNPMTLVTARHPLSHRVNLRNSGDIVPRTVPEGANRLYGDVSTLRIGGCMTGERRRSRMIAAIAAFSTIALVGGSTTIANADTAAGPVPTVSADSLPTAQINGVVWDQVIANGNVYATGSFTRARPARRRPGYAGGHPQRRSGIQPGHRQLIGWAPSLNAQGLTITASTEWRHDLHRGRLHVRLRGFEAQDRGCGRHDTGAVKKSFTANANQRVKDARAFRLDTVRGRQLHRHRRARRGPAWPRSPPPPER